MPIESALVVLVPEAEYLVRDFRNQLDRSAAAGVPAHVTIVYPFKPPVELTTETIAALHDLFSRTASFEVSFTGPKRFPGVLYLSPEPDELFRRLTERITEQFPEALPYGGKFADIVPHLTIAPGDDSPQLDIIAADFERQANARLPIRSTVKEVTLLDNQSGRWEARHHFLSAQD
ncbi:MAG TPA: 2'-5' RNA ligase family protein [Pyrinomonadaceae bacterium]